MHQHRNLVRVIAHRHFIFLTKIWLITNGRSLWRSCGRGLQTRISPWARWVTPPKIFNLLRYALIDISRCLVCFYLLIYKYSRWNLTHILNVWCRISKEMQVSCDQMVCTRYAWTQKLEYIPNSNIIQIYAKTHMFIFCLCVFFLPFIYSFSLQMVHLMCCVTCGVMGFAIYMICCLRCFLLWCVILYCAVSFYIVLCYCVACTTRQLLLADDTAIVVGWRHGNCCWLTIRQSARPFDAHHQVLSLAG